MNIGRVNEDIHKQPVKTRRFRNEKSRRIDDGCCAPWHSECVRPVDTSHAHSFSL